MVNSELIETLNGMIIHPIIRDVLTQEIEDGQITTIEELKQKAEEYEDEL